jgi:F-type H+-transporting ATPase subunit b
MKRKARIWPALAVLTACLFWLSHPVALRAADEGHDEPAHAAEGDDADHAPHDGGEHADTGHGSGNATRDMNPLSFDPDLAVFTVIVFVVLFVVLKKFAWGPISEALDERERGIADNIAAAQKTNDDAKALLVQYDERIAQAHEEVRLLLEEARRDAEQTQQEIVAKANQEADASKQRALAEIETATSQALKEVAEMGAEMAVGLAGRIIQAEVKPADHAKLIESVLAQVPGPNPSQN